MGTQSGQVGFLPPEVARELYTALLQKLIEAHPVTEDDLKPLNLERAEVIKEKLLAAGLVHPERVTVLDPSAADEKSEETASFKFPLDVRR
jgi:hypothetical protein